MKRIKAIVYGVGAMNSVATRLMLEKGVDIVGALARSPEKVGRDLGEVADSASRRACWSRTIPTACSRPVRRTSP